MRVSEIRVIQIRVNQGLGVIEREIKREKLQMKPHYVKSTAHDAKNKCRCQLNKKLENNFNC